jgi:hypothetical protein
MSVTPKQLTDALTRTIPAGHNVLITGAPGIGKTALIREATQAVGADLIVSHPAVEDPTDVKGLPFMHAGDTRANFYPFGQLATALAATRPTVWLLDDLGQASPAMQAGYMQLLHGGQVNGYQLPACVSFVAATNRRVDRAGVSGILEPVKSRFVSIVELEASIDEWCMWAYGHNITPTLIAFLRYRTPLLSAFTPTADLTNSPSPRTWEHLSQIEALNLPAPLESEFMAGAVGSGAATEYLAFRQMANSLVNLDAILLDPDKAKIPTNTSELYATAVGLAGRANRGNFARIATYATRLAVEADRGEFAVLLVRDAQRRDPDVQYSDAYVRMQCGPIGKLISGRE